MPASAALSSGRHAVLSVTTAVFAAFTGGRSIRLGTAVYDASRMALTLVTGGSGFVGSHVVRALAARGDELRLLARGRANLSHLDELEFQRATGDITDRR